MRVLRRRLRRRVRLGFLLALLTLVLLLHFRYLPMIRRPMPGRDGPVSTFFFFMIRLKMMLR